MICTKASIIGIILTTSVCFFCRAQQSSEREEMKLSSEVSGVTRYVYDFKYKDSILPLDLIHALNWEKINGFEFNAHGCKTLSTSYTYDPIRFTIYDYDGEQRIIVEDMFIGDTSNLYSGKRYFYNQDGKLSQIKPKLENGNMVQSPYLVKQYKNGLLVNECVVSNDSTVFDCEKVVETIKDNRKTTTFYKEGEQSWVKIADVNTGLLYSKIHYKKDGTLRDSEEHTYDQKGHLIKTVMGNGMFGGITYWYEVFEYNPDGTLKKKTRYDKNEISEVQDFSYDDHKNVVEEITTYLEQNHVSKTIYEYTYDDYGNWIIRLTYPAIPGKKLRPDRAEYRKLTYFR